MNVKLTALTVAILAGLAVPALAERGMDGDGPRGGGKGPRPSFAELDLNGDGFLTTEELAARRGAMFTDADRNGDGELSAAEINAAASERAQRNISEHTAKMIEKLDTDGNGTLSKAEIEARPQHDGKDHAKGKDGGKDHGKDREKDRGKRHGKDRGGLERMFERLDTNDDGKLSAEEFEAMKGHGKRGGSND